LTWKTESKLAIAITLSNLETYLSGIDLPSKAEAIIRPVDIPTAFQFGKVSFFLLEMVSSDTALAAFPLLVFRTKEDTIPAAGEMKEIRLYGLSGGDRVSLNSYVRGIATIRR
jgi:hypothetical protein